MHSSRCYPSQKMPFAIYNHEGFFLAYKSNIDSQLRGFWFAPNGLDTNSGETLEVPKLTIQAAIDSAAALVPPPSFNFSGFVTAAQGGEFFDPFVMVESVSLDGTNCNLIVDAPIAVTMASSGLFNMTAISNAQDSGICVKVEDNTIRGIDLLFMGVEGDNGIGMEISGTVSDLFSSTRLITLEGENSTGYDITSTNSNPIDIDVKVVNLTADGTTFINYNPVTTTDVTNVNVSTVETDAAMITGTAFDLDNGILVVRAGVINTPTFATLDNSSQLTIRAQTIAGDLILNEASACTIKSVAFYVGDIDVNNTATLFIDAQVLFGNIDMEENTNGIAKVGFMTGDLNIDGTLFIEIETLVGDITVGVGATFNCDIASHVGTVTNNGTINGNIGPHIEDNTTSELDIEKVLVPDGNRGVEWKPAFGGEYQFESDEPESTTTSETFQNKVTLTTPSIPAGNYRITSHAEITNDSGDKPVVVQIVLDASLTNDFFYAPKFEDEYLPFQSFVFFALTAGVHVLEIEFAATSEGGTAKIRRARLEIFRVN